jgi:hypothetical protein
MQLRLGYFALEWGETIADTIAWLAIRAGV